MKKNIFSSQPGEKTKQLDNLESLLDNIKLDEIPLDIKIENYLHWILFK